MSAATLDWLGSHVRRCPVCSRDLGVVLRANAALCDLICSVASGGAIREPSGRMTFAFEDSLILDGRERFASVVDRVGADVERDLSNTVLRMLAWRALRMTGVHGDPISADRASAAATRDEERHLAAEAEDRLRDLDGLREPVRAGLRRGVLTLLHRRRSRERMRRDYQTARVFLAWGQGGPPPVPALSDLEACRAAREWAERVIGPERRFELHGVSG